jgi:hypothetical protein
MSRMHLCLCAALLLGAPDVAAAQVTAGDSDERGIVIVNGSRGIVIVNGAVAGGAGVLVNGRVPEQRLLLIDGTVTVRDGAVHVEGAPVAADSLVLPLGISASAERAELEAALRGGPRTAVVFGSAASSGGDIIPVEQISTTTGRRTPTVRRDVSPAAVPPPVSIATTRAEGGLVRLVDPRAAAAHPLGARLGAMLRGDGEGTGVLVVSGAHVLLGRLMVASGRMYDVRRAGLVEIR